MQEVLAELATFETDRLILRPFRFTDAADLFAILSDPEATRFLQPPQTSLAACQSLLVEAFIRRPLGIWALEDKDSGRMIGAIRLENIKQRQLTAEIGYFLSRDYWRQGLMTEALDTLVYLCFCRLGLTRLIIKTHADNQASQKLAEKAGFT